jgi:acetoin utilization deacetylase AcuC-like enzyme
MEKRSRTETITVGNDVMSYILSSINTKIDEKKKINMVCYIYDDKCKNHEQIPNKDADGKLVPHQESKKRVTQINECVKKTGLSTLLISSGSVDLKRSDLLKIHTRKHVEYVEEVCKENKPRLFKDPYTDVSISNFSSLESIYAAVASVKGAINQVCSNNQISIKHLKKQHKKNKTKRSIYRSNIPKRSFCNVRPPGHHAHSDHGSGFCFMNNVGCGAKYALDTYPDTVKRVLIFDWDLHHGNGTQEIFANYDDRKDNSVFYASIHRGNDFYPFTGTFEDNKYYSNVLNIPLKANCTIDEYMDKFNNIFLPRAYEYKPDLIIISAGFDSHKDDLYSELPLDYEDYVYMTQKLIDLANNCADGKIVSVLEGGYTTHVLIRAVTSHIATLIDYDGGE